LTEQIGTKSEAEKSSVTAPTVLPGLGYPNDRQETSPEPTGWQGIVSREARAWIGEAEAGWPNLARDTSPNVSRETTGATE
jgi:hypothetical protein